METGTPTILVTGGSRGIGAATVLLAAQSGYDVCFSYRSRAADADRVCAAVEEAGRRSLAVQADFAHEDAIVDLWREAVNAFGSIDALVNNVGMLETQKPLADFDVDRLTRVFTINTIGTFVSAREAVRHMSTARGGRGGVIVNVSSLAARLGSPHEYIDYAAAKAAIDTMTIGLAKEVAAEGIRVNAVRPGGTYTEIHASGGEPDRIERVKQHVPMKRGAQPSEIAEAILWLVSDRASYATGTIIDVAGGV